MQYGMIKKWSDKKRYVKAVLAFEYSKIAYFLLIFFLLDWNTHIFYEMQKQQKETYSFSSLGSRK